MHKTWVQSPSPKKFLNNNGIKKLALYQKKKGYKKESNTWKHKLPEPVLRDKFIVTNAYIKKVTRS
jgi:hypothetical protein